ncbi:MAG: DUF2442 domain-containing protein [Victivallaceae bacterium]|nr:DUF2442 domain-containing protein [Victivallaceae bacterium]
MDCVYLNKAKYLGKFRFFLQFNDGVQGEIDLKPIIEKYDQAALLKNENEIAKFYLDSWPTLAWDCGFDIAPETLHKQCEQNGCRNAPRPTP